MALVKCKECGKEVASSAKTCPHCGIKEPGVTAKQKAGGCLVILVLAAAIGYWMSGDSSDDKSSSTTAAKCEATDGECVAQKLMSDPDVIRGCKSPLEKSVKFEYEWTDGIMTPTFSRYLLTNNNKTITLIGDQLKVTNAFNAKLPMTYYCIIDVESHKVLNVKAEQGRL